MSEEDGMPTVQNLSEVQRKCGVRGRTELHERESTMNRNKNPVIRHTGRLSLPLVNKDL